MADSRELMPGQQVWWNEGGWVNTGTVVAARHRQVVLDTPSHDFKLVDSSAVDTEKAPVLARAAGILIERAKADQESARDLMLHLADIAKVNSLAASARSLESVEPAFRL